MPLEVLDSDNSDEQQRGIQSQFKYSAFGPQRNSPADARVDANLQRKVVRDAVAEHFHKVITLDEVTVGVLQVRRWKKVLGREVPLPPTWIGWAAWR